MQSIGRIHGDFHMKNVLLTVDMVPMDIHKLRRHLEEKQQANPWKPRNPVLDILTAWKHEKATTTFYEAVPKKLYVIDFGRTHKIGHGE